MCICKIVFKGGGQSNPGLQAEQDTNRYTCYYKVACGKGHQGIERQVSGRVWFLTRGMGSEEELCCQGSMASQGGSTSGRHSKALVLLQGDFPLSRSFLPAFLRSPGQLSISHVLGAQVPERKSHTVSASWELMVCLKIHR